MGILDLFLAGSRVRIEHDEYGAMPKSLIGKEGRVISRVRRQDVDGDKAYAVLPKGRKRPKLVWGSEMSKKSRRRKSK